MNPLIYSQWIARQRQRQRQARINAARRAPPEPESVLPEPVSESVPPDPPSSSSRRKRSQE